MRHLIGAMTTATLLAGCTAYTPFDPLQTSGALLTTEGAVTVKARILPGGYLDPPAESGGLGYRTAAVIPNHTQASVAHLQLSLFSVEGGTETPVKDASGSALVKRVAAAEAEAGLTIPRLTIGKSYRVKATAYKAVAGSEPVAISSEVTVDFALDKLKPSAALDIRLVDVAFDGTATAPGVVVTPSEEVSHEGPVELESHDPG